VVECDGWAATHWVSGSDVEKNSKIRALERKDFSTDFGCAGEENREGVVEKRGPSMEEKEKLREGQRTAASETKATNRHASLGYHSYHSTAVPLSVYVMTTPLAQESNMQTHHW